MKTVLIFLAAVLIAFTATAQQGINYKALVKDNLGNVVANQTIDVRFTIIADTGPTNVYVETHTGVATDANGIVILNIGEGTTSDVFTDIAWGSDTHALKVEIDIEQDASFVDMGTTQFMAVPYALSAANTASKIDELTDGKSDANGSSLFLGIDAGLNDDGTDNNNVGIGYQALFSNTTGSGNIANGFQALYSNGIGSTNTAIGYQAGYSNTGQNSIYIGYQSGYNEQGGSKLYIENSDADADNALIYGEFNTNILRTNSEFQIGNPANAGYAFPVAGGEYGQVLQSTGNGQTTWASSVQSINDLSDGKSDADGSSVFLGIDAGLNDDGSDNKNVAVGFEALKNNTIGTGNTANGVQALYSNTTGSNNIAIGNNALYFNETGSYNTANGRAALNRNATGNKNTANGYNALFFNSEGINNTATGYQALYFNLGTNNTANGYASLYSNTTGGENTANGYRTLYSNTKGYFNTATGNDALYFNSIGNSNTANGSLALFYNTTGDSNTANGSVALYSNTSGGNNTANGKNALVNNTEGNRNTANGSRTLYYNTGSDNTATGFEALNYNNTGIRNTANGTQALYLNTIGNYNTATGYKALYSSKEGNWNTAFGRQALFNLLSGTNNIGVGYDAQVPSPTGNDQIRIGNTSINYAGVQVAWTVTSDLRWKEHIRALPYGLAFVKQLQPVDYMRKNNEHKTREMGFIAQDVEALLTKVGYTEQGFLTKDDKGFMSLRYNDFIALLTKAIQEQQEIIEEQKMQLNAQTLKIEEQDNKNDKQDNNIEKLLKRVEQLETMNNQ